MHVAVTSAACEIVSELKVGEGFFFLFLFFYKKKKEGKSIVQEFLTAARKNRDPGEGINPFKIP